MAAERRTPESPRTRGPQCALSRPVPPRSAPAPPPPPGPAPVPAAQRNSPPHVRPSPRRAASPRPVSTAGTRGGGRVTCAASALSSPQRLAGARTFRAVPPRLSLTVGGGGICVYKTSRTRVTGAWLRVRTWCRNQSRALLGESGRVASLHPDLSHPSREPRSPPKVPGRADAHPLPAP